MHANFQIDQLLDGLEVLTFRRGCEGDGRSGSTGAPGATDMVHVVLRLRRHVVVEHVADPAHVQSASRHVGGNQNADLASAKRFHGLQADRLGHVSVQGFDLDPVTSQRPYQFVDCPFAVAEHERRLDGRIAQ